MCPVLVACRRPGRPAASSRLSCPPACLPSPSCSCSFHSWAWRCLPAGSASRPMPYLPGSQVSSGTAQSKHSCSASRQETCRAGPGGAKAPGASRKAGGRGARAGALPRGRASFSRAFGAGWATGAHPLVLSRKPPGDQALARASAHVSLCLCLGLSVRLSPPSSPCSPSPWD